MISLKLLQAQTDASVYHISNAKIGYDARLVTSLVVGAFHSNRAAKAMSNDDLVLIMLLLSGRIYKTSYRK